MTPASTDSAPTVLQQLEHYYDTVPRATANAEDHNPLVLFVARTGWPFYARPALGHDRDIKAADVTGVLDRQRELGVPRALEWVAETTPSLLSAALSAGMRVEQCPLLVLVGPPKTPDIADIAFDVRLMSADDPSIALVRAAIHVGFGTLGTAVGAASVAERDAEAATNSAVADRVSESVRVGRSVLAGAFDAESGPVGGGSHNPRGQVTEVVGVGVLPAFRRRGIAGAVTATLARDALDHDVTTVFCSAQDDDVARVYESVGFHRIGTACVAEAE